MGIKGSQITGHLIACSTARYADNKGNIRILQN